MVSKKVVTQKSGTGEKEEPVKKVNRYKQNCPLQDNLDNKGMTKWNCEKVPLYTAKHLNVSLINSRTVANSAKSKKKVQSNPLVIYNMTSGNSCWILKGTSSYHHSMLVRFVSGHNDQNKVLHFNVLFEK